MYKIFGISDIHTEFYKEDEIQGLFESLKIPPVDYLILAGDIGNPTTAYFQYFRFLELCKSINKNIFLISGNHEYYESNYNMEDIENKIRKMCIEIGITFLQNESILHNGIRFIGSTLWSLVEKQAFKDIGDSYYKVFRSHIEYSEKFIDSLKFLRKTLLESKEPCIVITHHVPTEKVIHTRYRGDNLSSAFYTDIVYSLNLKKCRYWFCGHTHETAKLRLSSGAFIIVNPVGYRDERRTTKTFTEPEILKLD
jgi:predicted phosphodiesterase